MFFPGTPLLPPRAGMMAKIFINIQLFYETVTEA
jgi:hypothetical protein